MEISAGKVHAVVAGVEVAEQSGGAGAEPAGDGAAAAVTPPLIEPFSTLK